MMHISKGAWQGVIAATFAELLVSETDLIKKYKTEAFDKYAGKDERWGVFFSAGIAFAEPLVEAIRRCGRDLTREKLVQELEKMKNFKGISGKISYKPFNPDDPILPPGAKPGLSGAMPGRGQGESAQRLDNRRLIIARAFPGCSQSTKS